MNQRVKGKYSWKAIKITKRSINQKTQELTRLPSWWIFIKRNGTIKGVSTAKAHADLSKSWGKSKKMHHGVCSQMNLLNDKDVGLNRHRGLVDVAAGGGAAEEAGRFDLFLQAPIYLGIRHWSQRRFSKGYVRQIRQSSKYLVPELHIRTT